MRAWREYLDEVIGGMISSHVPRKLIYTQVFANARAWNVYIFVRGQLRHAAVLELERSGDIGVHEHVFPIIQDEHGAWLRDEEVVHVPTPEQVWTNFVRRRAKNRPKGQNESRKGQNESRKG